MSHTHNVVDTDKHFIIDAITRAITTESNELTLMQGDHNSEIYTFGIPKVIEGHDMSECNRVEIHFNNVSNDKVSKSADIYYVSDLRVDEADPEKLAFSWLVSGNATKYAGALAFRVRFCCIDENGKYTYKWHTEIFKGITISDGLDNTAAVEEEFSDAFSAWEARLNSLEDKIDSNVNPIAKTEDMTQPVGVDENGQLYTAPGGSDYTLPVGGDELGGVKNGGNVVINEDGTMTAPESKVTDEQVSSAVSEWIEANPEATTTVQDGSVGLSKLAFGTHNSDNGAFAYFTGDKIFGAQVYGVYGIIVPCRAGQTLYANFNLSTQVYTDVRILSAIPKKPYGSLANEIGVLPANSDRVYTIPSDLTNAACAFFPTWFNVWNGQNFATEDEALEALRSRYTTGAGGSGGRVQTQPFEDFPAWLHTCQSGSFAVSSDKNIALYASLYKAVSPMVGANVCILGDSLTEQSADDASPTGWMNGSYDGYGWYSRIARKYLQKFRYKGNGGCRWFGETSCIEDVKTVIAEGVAYDYIILEYGTNDITLGGIGDVTDVANENAETSIQAIRYCIETLQEAFPSTRIIVIMPCMRNSNAKSTQATYYEKVGAVLREYGVRMCNMAWDSGVTFNMMQGDGIHLRNPLVDDNNVTYYTNDTEACARYSKCLESTMLMA